MKRAHILSVAGVAGLGLLLAACGGNTGAANGGYTTPAAPAASAAAPAANQVALHATTSGALGTIVTDASGMTLYRFDKDTAKPSASNCAGTCAATWPPALVTGSSVALSGVDGSEVGTVTRADGTKQLTIGGWPVYRFSKDTAPGDVKGEGVGGTWYAVTPQGKKALPSQAASSNDGYNYGSGY